MSHISPIPTPTFSPKGVRESTKKYNDGRIGPWSSGPYQNMRRAGIPPDSGHKPSTSMPSLIDTVLVANEDGNRSPETNNGVPYRGIEGHPTCAVGIVHSNKVAHGRRSVEKNVSSLLSMAISSWLSPLEKNERWDKGWINHLDRLLHGSPNRTREIFSGPSRPTLAGPACNPPPGRIGRATKRERNCEIR
jgi:hypothetical protein